MHIISRRAHGVLDYLVGILLILSPKIFGLEGGMVESRLPVILGITTLIYSLCTNYELGLLKLIPFRAHLVLDAVSGALLAISPWVFQFADRVWVPHLVFGLLVLGVVLLTRTTASVHQRPGEPATRM